MGRSAATAAPPARRAVCRDSLDAHRVHCGPTCIIAMGPASAAALLLLIFGVVAYSQDLQIGVVEDTGRAQALAAAVEAALREAEVEGQTRVAPVPSGRPLSPPRHVCEQAASGAAAALGGGGLRAQVLAHEAAARAGMPLLLVDPAPRIASAAWEALQLHPHPDVYAQACRDLCREKGWTRAVLLHEGGAGPAARLAPDAHPLALLARQLPPTDADPSVLRTLMLVLKKLSADKFIVWCSAECALRVLDAAQRAGLAGARHAFLLLAPELRAADLQPYSHGGANVTALRLFDPAAPAVRRYMAAWRAAYARRRDDAADDAELQAMQDEPPTALLLARDAATLTARALAALDLPALPSADCDAGHGAFHADTLLNYLRSEDWNDEDTSGPISWEADGSRRDVRFEVLELVRGGELRHAGAWGPRAGIVWQRSDAPAPAVPRDSMTNRTFNILIARNKPYVMRRESTRRLSGNDRYEGFCIELIEKLAAILQFNYTFIEHIGGYGSKQSDGEWNGMIGRLRTDMSVEFAITDLTITADREQAVDFTTPFMNLGISILFRKPEPPEPQLFAFLLPFSNEVWLCLGLAYLGSSLLLYVVGRLCHEEWQNPYPCIEEPHALENQFTLGNALWFNLGAVLMQGSEIAPAAYGTRAVASAWWVFALVIASSYTANLATLLAKRSTTELIHNVEELAHNTLGIDYGAKKGGSTYTFFESSQNPLYKEMFEYMKTRTMPGSNEEGIEKVMSNTSLYAFLSESTSIEYEVERNCQLTKVGPLLDSKGYGIAMRKDSEYRQALNLALLNLQEAGVLRKMKNTWWNEKHGGGACKAPEEFGSKGLEMKNFRGLFLVLAVGCALGLLLSALDLAVSTLRRARALREPFWRRLAAELRFVFRFEQSIKPLHGPLSSSSSGSSPAAEAEAEAEVEAEAEAEAVQEEETRRDTPRRRRRSSMHAASLRLARHTARDSATPAPQPQPQPLTPRQRSQRSAAKT